MQYITLSIAEKATITTRLAIASYDGESHDKNTSVGMP